MNKRIFMTPVRFTFQKPIIERDDGQNNNPCVATHSKETCVA